MVGVLAVGLIDEVHGSIGGVVLSGGAGRVVVRARGGGSGDAAMRVCAAAWSRLPERYRRTWRCRVGGVYRPRFGSFCACNLARVRAGLPIEAVAL